MLEVSATDFVKHFGQYRERVQREIIAITSHGRTSGYFVSEQEYKEYALLKEQQRKAYTLSELPESTLNALSSVEMDSRHDHLNTLVSISELPSL